jgi:hypothetical protein
VTDTGAASDGAKSGLEAALSRLGRRFAWTVLAVMAGLMLFILFAPLLGIPQQRRLSADVAAFDRTARTATVQQVAGHANWQTDRTAGRRSGRYSFNGFDLYLRDGERLRFACLSENACPPGGKEAVKVPDAVRVFFVRTPAGYRLPIEIRDMAGRVIISRAAALAQIDRRAQAERAHPYDPVGDHWLFFGFVLIFAHMGWSIWRDLRSDKAKTADPV